jgi:uncharacterized membrane protein (GlpM family)
LISILFQTIVPFILSALIVVIITVIAERYGTKVGGILGTLPSTIVIAFLFIALTNSIEFATVSVLIVPAEMGINLIFLMLFAVFAYKSFKLAIVGSLGVWAILSTFLFYSSLSILPIALMIYVIALASTFFILENGVKISSIGRRKVRYSSLKIIMRGMIAGFIIAVSVVLSNLSAILSGIFSVFPAIFLSTMIISYREHGPDFVGGMAKSMIFGTPSVTSYAVSIYFLYPRIGLVWGSITAYCIGILITIMLFSIRSKLK